MRKEEYIQKLEQLLYNIPAEDRYEAIQFYSDYLEDAGADVDEVLRSLGTPEELAQSIQKDLYGDNEAGDYTRTYKDVPGTYRVPFSTGGRFSGQGNVGQNSAGFSEETKTSAGPKRKGKLTAGQWILLIVLTICAAPVIVPVVVAIWSVIFAIVIVIAVIIFCIGIVGVVLVISAIILLVLALVKMIASPFSSLVMIGGSLLMIGLGLIGIAFTVWMICKVVPKLFGWFANLCSGLVHRK